MADFSGDSGDESSVVLLERFAAGDRDALAALIERHRSWLHRLARRRLGAHLRELGDSEDVVQEVLTALLTYGPLFVPASDEQFRGLLARMVINQLHSLHRYGTAGRRDLDRARALQSGEVSRIGCSESSRGAPDRLAQAREEAAMLQVALGLLEPEDRRIIEMHRYDGLSFADIGAELSIKAKTANKRFSRAVVRLGRELRALARGEVAAPFEADGEAADEAIEDSPGT